MCTSVHLLFIQSFEISRSACDVPLSPLGDLQSSCIMLGWSLVLDSNLFVAYSPFPLISILATPNSFFRSLSLVFSS